MIPTLRTPDSSLDLVRNGYRFVSRHADRLGVDSFRTRLLLRPVLCIRGGAAARFFYEGGRFDRTGSMPVSVVHLLQDLGSVQTLEGEAHRHRKQGFVDVLIGEAALQGFAEQAREEIERAVDGWRGRGPVTMHEELPPVLTRLAMRWAGVPAAFADLDVRGPELWDMVEQAGTFGPLNWIARARRLRTERWARELIAGVRAGTVPVADDVPLRRVADWTTPQGTPLPLDIAAVELLNLLRPIVAVALFIEFALLAMVREPVDRQALAADPSATQDFVTEVRRYAPFFPVIAGRTQHELSWEGEVLPERSWVLLDLYGTNHDPRLWPEPDRFDPGRYARGDGDARTIVAQGFGDYVTDHRCPGEPATVRIMAEATRVLAAAAWEPVPGQDLRVRFASLPAHVRSGLVLRFT
ncbi:cytochrome P450 [Georgenia sp. TF02-10]|uniref:cytochrome P450 n=1 Tax=Georgenia sp. TF02-10 TaxID=2917725 RepID=UPI001FA6D972|nr:cytochrome P450 [Georgenia sp. TF02-10]UNX55791.1 cytochrome P450 [Georgenia sp. TF02-10]